VRGTEVSNEKSVDDTHREMLRHLNERMQYLTAEWERTRDNFIGIFTNVASLLDTFVALEKRRMKIESDEER
jgi:hypothetical protein